MHLNLNPTRSFNVSYQLVLLLNAASRFVFGLLEVICSFISPLLKKSERTSISMIVSQLKLKLPNALDSVRMTSSRDLGLHMR
jgi:hypothetical protein